MSGDDKSPDGRSPWAWSALLIGLLAVFGFSLPVGESGSRPTTTSTADSENANLKTDDDRAAFSANASATPSKSAEWDELLRILEPLDRAYALPRPDAPNANAADDERRSLNRLRELLAPRTHPPRLLTMSVPDPSENPLNYDAVIAAVQLAMETYDFYRKPSADPWTGKPRPSDPNQPHALLFQHRPRSDSEPRQPDWLILLIKETALNGLRPPMLWTCLDVLDHQRIWLASPRSAAASAPSPSPSPLPFRFTGPFYSGSQASLKRGLVEWVRARGSDRWGRKPSNDPSATAAPPPIATNDQPVFRLTTHTNTLADARDIGEALRSAAIESDGSAAAELAKIEPRLWIKADATASVYGDLIQAVETFVKTRVLGDADAPIAYLREESTGFGKATPTRSEPPFVRYYTRHISELMQIYERSDAKKGKSRLPSALSSPSPSQTPIRTNSEQMALVGGSASIITDEQKLIDALQEIRARRFRAVGIWSSDMQDRLFLCRMVRTYCPEALIFTTNGFLAWTHSEEIRWMRGVIVVNSYPLNSRIQEWIRDDANPSPARMFSANRDYAVYNALAVQFWEATPALRDSPPRLQGYGMPTIRWDSHREAGAASQGPPIWISVVSQQGLFPLRVINPESKSATKTDRAGIWSSRAPDSPRTDAPDDGERPVPSWLISGATGWRAIFLLTMTLHFASGGLYLIRSARARVSQRNGGARPRRSDYHRWRGLPFQADLLFWTSLRFGDSPSEVERRRTLFLMGSSLWLTQVLIASPAWLPLLYAPIDALAAHGTRLLWADLLIFAAFWLIGLTGVLTALDHWTGALGARANRIKSDSRWVFRLAMAGLILLIADRFPIPYLPLVAVCAIAALALGWAILQRSRRRPRGWPAPLLRWLTRGQDDLTPQAIETMDRLALAARLAFAAGALMLAVLLTLQALITPAQALAFALFRERASALTSGVSPLLPFVLAAFAWLVLGLSRLRLLDLRDTSNAGSELLSELLDEPAASSTALAPSSSTRQPARDLMSALGLMEGQSPSAILKHAPPRFWAAVAVGTAIFVWIYAFRQGSLECWGLNLLLYSTLFGLGSIVLLQGAKLASVWLRFREFADAFVEHPASRGFDRLPNVIARDFGKYFEPLASQIYEESHLRSPQARRGQTLQKNLSDPAVQNQLKPQVEAAQGILDARYGSISASDAADSLRPTYFFFSPTRRLSPALAKALGPFWDRLSAGQVLSSGTSGAGDKGDKSKEKDKEKDAAASSAWTLNPPSSPSCSSPPSPQDDRKLEAWLTEAEDYIAHRAVTYVNAIVHQIWTRVTALALCGGLLFVAVSSYPMQPYRIGAQTAAAVTLSAAAVILWILVSYQSNPLISRITKRTGGFSAFSPEFAGRFLAYIGSLVGIVAAASAGMADLLRIWLEPWLS